MVEHELQTYCQSPSCRAEVTIATMGPPTRDRIGEMLRKLGWLQDDAGAWHCERCVRDFFP